MDAVNWPTVIGSILAFAMLAGLFYWKDQSLKKQGKTWQEYINNEILDSHVLGMLVLIVAVNLSEGVLAASIEGAGEGHNVNGIARFFAHISISSVSAMLMISAPLQLVKALQAVGQSTKAKKNVQGLVFTKAILELLLFVATFGVAIYLPYANYTVIASGLGELEIAQLAFYELMPVFDGRAIKLASGYGATYRPLDNMSYTMYASYILMLVHYVVTMLDGMYAAKRFIELRIEEAQGKSTEAKRSYVKDRIKAAPPSQSEIDKVSGDPAEIIEYLMRQAGNKQQKRNARSLASETAKRLQADLTTQQLVVVAKTMCELRDEFVRLNKTTIQDMDEAAKNALRQRIVQRTRDFFRKASTDGGLGLVLSHT